jgi:hypothetical protein
MYDPKIPKTALTEARGEKVIRTVAAPTLVVDEAGPT